MIEPDPLFNALSENYDIADHKVEAGTVLWPLATMLALLIGGALLIWKLA
jgi:hypothetical protein